MAQIIVRGLDERVKARLRVRAAQHGRSMEAEAREILAAAVAESGDDPIAGLRAVVERVGGFDDAQPPERREAARAAVFEP